MYDGFFGGTVEPTLVVIGVSFRSAPVAVREGFWINESRYAEILSELLRCEAVDEVAVLSTCNRTEFIVWTPDASRAANSVQRYLTRGHRLRLTDWSKFHRHVGDAALIYLLRLAAGLDSLVFGEADITASMEFAYKAGIQTRSTGRCLEAILLKALAAARRVRTETEIDASRASHTSAPAELAGQLYDDLGNRSLVIFGDTKKAHRIADGFRTAALSQIEIVSANFGLEALRTPLERADLLVMCLPDAPFALRRNQLADLIRERKNRLVIIDTCVPRNVDPSVAELPGVVLRDIDQLNEFVLRNARQQHTLFQAGKILQQEAAGFLKEVASLKVNPLVAEFRSHLERVCSEELQRLSEEYGPFTEEQHAVLNILAEHIRQRIASSLARTLTEAPDNLEQEALSNFLQGLFRAEKSMGATANGEDTGLSQGAATFDLGRVKSAGD